jgi:hypothetical protein
MQSLSIKLERNDDVSHGLCLSDNQQAIEYHYHVDTGESDCLHQTITIYHHELDDLIRQLENNIIRLKELKIKLSESLIKSMQNDLEKVESCE